MIRILFPRGFSIIYLELFKESGKKIRICFEVATMESITKIFFLKRPKILHISCHGAYDEKGNFYLQFEEKNGDLLKFGIEELKHILNDPPIDDMESKFSTSEKNISLNNQTLRINNKNSIKNEKFKRSKFKV